MPPLSQQAPPTLFDTVELLRVRLVEPAQRPYASNPGLPPQLRMPPAPFGGRVVDTANRSGSNARCRRRRLPDPRCCASPSNGSGSTDHCSRCHRQVVDANAVLDHQVVQDHGPAMTLSVVPYGVRSAATVESRRAGQRQVVVDVEVSGAGSVHQERRSGGRGVDGGPASRRSAAHRDPGGARRPAGATPPETARDPPAITLPEAATNGTHERKDRIASLPTRFGGDGSPQARSL